MPSRNQPPELQRIVGDHRRVIVRLRITYLFALISCVLFLTLCPVWIGKTYHLENGGYHLSCGRFGFDGKTLCDRYPVWDPPHAHVQESDSKVLWPWQEPYWPCHVEIDVGGAYFWLIACLLVLGIALKMAYLTFAPGVSDWFVTLAWLISIGMLLLLIFVLWVSLQLSGGMG